MLLLSSVTKVTKRTFGVLRTSQRLTIVNPLGRQNKKLFCSAAITAIKANQTFKFAIPPMVPSLG